MPLLSTNLFQSSSLRVFTHLTLLLPVTLAVGCSGLFQRADIIDYTVTETEYHAELKARQSPTTKEPTLAAATPAKAPVVTPPTVAPPVITPPAPKKPVKVKPVKAKLFDLPKTAHTKNVADSKTGFTGRDPISAKKVKNKKVKNKGKKLKVARALPGVEYRYIEYINTSDFTRTFYATAGLGISRVNPDTSASATFSADEIIDGGGQVALGFDVAKRLSLEVHAADLGSTGLAPNGRVSNNLNGVSALIYTSKNLNQFRRRGWNGYARLGYTQLRNTPVGNANIESITTNSALLGVGAEYNTPWGIGFRADLIATENDVQYGQLGVLYRAGKRSKKPRLARALPDPAGNIPAGIIPSNNAAGAVVQPVIINDNVPGPTTARGPTIARAQSTQITANPVAADPTDDLRLPKPALSASQTHSDSCSSLNGTLKDVNFYTSSADLTQAAMASLNRIAGTLNTCTSRNVIISAHTDSEGSVANNNSLSKKRARNVAFHLARKGVSFDRISAVAYGESQPIASNDTAEGRSQNRRVELLVQ